jgi:hypothetical protein
VTRLGGADSRAARSIVERGIGAGDVPEAAERVHSSFGVGLEGE